MYSITDQLLNGFVDAPQKGKSQTPVPFIPDNIVAFLNELVPEKCPSKNDCERTIWMYVGKRELVNRLIHLNQRQKEKK